MISPTALKASTSLILNENCLWNGATPCASPVAIPTSGVDHEVNENVEDKSTHATNNPLQDAYNRLAMLFGVARAAGCRPSSPTLAQEADRRKNMPLKAECKITPLDISKRGYNMSLLQCC